MRIALIDITNLTRVRETFNPGWRTFTAVTFLLSVLFWWWALTLSRSWADVAAQLLMVRTFILAAVVLIPLAVALFRKNDFARIFFVIAIAFNFLTLTLFLLLALPAAGPVSLRDNMAVFLLLLGVLAVVAVYVQYLIRPFYLLLLSLTPFGPWKAFRRQVLYCLRLWAGEWKEVGEPRSAGEGVRPYPTPGAHYRLALGWSWFALGVMTVGVALFGLVNEEFLPAVGRLELSKAWHMLAHFEVPEPSEATGTVGGAAIQLSYIFLVLGLALCCFFVFGFFLTQWRREHVRVYRARLLEHMTASDLLLLRSFGDDVKYVARAKVSIWTLIFRVYGWSYTFEQLIVNRLGHLGRVLLLDFKQQRKELLSKPGVRLVARAVGRKRLLKFLISVLPAVWYRLPAQGGVRYYVKTRRREKEWQEEVGKAMLLARVIILLLGETGGLSWEMKEVGRLSLSRKTLFVMPPLFWGGNYRARWRQFADSVCAPLGCDMRLLMKKVNPKRVLAVTVHEDTLVVMTGKQNSQPFYESALDVASLLAVAEPAQSGVMIRKYLK